MAGSRWSWCSSRSRRCRIGLPAPALDRERTGHELARNHQDIETARPKTAYDVHCWGQAFQPGGPVWVYCPITQVRRVLEGSWGGSEVELQSGLPRLPGSIPARGPLRAAIARAGGEYPCSRDWSEWWGPRGSLATEDSPLVRESLRLRGDSGTVNPLRGWG